MNCPRCSAPIPPPADLTQRTTPCPGCGTQVDLASDAGATTARPLPAPPAPAAPAGDDPWVGRAFAAGRYTIEALLGVGGMGRVYRARQTALGRAVAVKILSPELARDEGFRRRFEREAGTLAALEHPRIVTVHDVGVEGEVPYIVMALVVGPKGVPVSLRDLLDAGTVEEELALRIIQETCAALEYAHGKGVIHRDIKPGNILLDAEGHAKIADFGIARVVGASEAAHLTTTGTVLGTMRYMAPEQLADAARADARSDLYSLGVVFYEMLTGQSPVGRFELPSEVRPGLDHRLDAIVDRALRRAATQRYANAGEMARDLSRITTEREYGRLRDAEVPAAAAAGATGAKGGAGSGGGGGRPPSSAGGSAAPVAARPPPPQDSTGPTPTPTSLPASAPNRRALVVGALALAVIGGGLAAYFATRGSASPAAATVGQGGPGTSPAAPPPGRPPGPEPTPAPGAPDPAGMRTDAPAMAVAPPPAAMEPAPTPPTPVKPPAKPSDPPPGPSVPNAAKTGLDTPAPGGLPPTGGATPEARRLLEEARNTALELLTSDALVEESYQGFKSALPASGSVGERLAAQQALEVQLGRWKAGRTTDVVADIPGVVLARGATAMGLSLTAMRAASAEAYAEMHLRNWKLRGAQSVGNGFVLVLYDATLGDAGEDDDLETRVGIAVLEGSAWKVFP